ncbi:Piso0_002963 [Millerozyma farinosa CBS 7064]|uniref:U three protein 7 n=1 Tax=Pichia sorbitophila (strain ATCC MYA-4447 / BCRC 22081 / CBS 7064 / NBRC 10061 / NRRL Y-12695) TaxID=559304 RepID=G8YGT4_PICSO|nr:Piso0_002963 [Millerozyma farinosa CBS 7064]CCE80636.1 Piso0_002963 [Millerozyma farinosa CBS 7064]
MVIAGKMGSYDRPNSTKYEREGADKFKSKSRYSKDKKLNGGLKKADRQYKEAINAAAGTDILLQEDAGFLEAEGPMEKTFKFKQDEIAEAVDASTSNKKFDLKLPEFGPYTIDYGRNGRQLLIGGLKGHVASFDWQKGKLDCELHLNETVRSVKHLHNDQYFAVAQKKYVFIYDKTGMELHRLKQHIDVSLLDFLPYHFLLATAGNTGFLKFHDVSTGNLVSELRTKLGPTQAMKQNPWNAVMHLGHGNGTVTLWSPTMPTPLVKIQAARGAVRDIAVDREGKYMAVAGADKTLKIWDIRNFKEAYSYYTPTPATSLDISDTGLLSVSWGPHITVWKDALKKKQNSPYMNHIIPGSKIEKSKFVPFEDILGAGHQKGFSSLIIPGAGEANFDALEANPYESAKQRQEHEVKSLLNKLPADSIALDPTVIGTVNRKAKSIRLKPGELKELENSENSDKNAKVEIKPEVKGSNSALRRHLRNKRHNVIDQRKLRIEKSLKKEKEARQRKVKLAQGIHEEPDRLSNVLSRFK